MVYYLQNKSFSFSHSSKPRGNRGGVLEGEKMATNDTKQKYLYLLILSEADGGEGLLSLARKVAERAEERFKAKWLARSPHSPLFFLKNAEYLGLIESIGSHCYRITRFGEEHLKHIRKKYFPEDSDELSIATPA